MTALVFSCILVALGVITLIYDVIMINIMNYNSGMLLLAVFAIVLIAIGVCLKWILSLRWLCVTLAVCFVLMFILIGFIYAYGLNNTSDYKEDAVIVLGCGITGERVMGQLADRLNAAVEYSKKNPNAIIVVSGGQGPNESITEALAMERYLVRMGVPKKRIIKEEKSTSTQSNLQNSKQILDKYFEREYTVVIITGHYHIYRAVSYAKDYGFDCKHYYATVDAYHLPITSIRECAAVLKMWLLD